jgi:PhnB protein
MVQPIPDRFHSITPYLIVSDGAAAIDFYVKAFGATELYRMPGPDGKSVMHAEIQIGDSVVMLAGSAPWMDIAVPQGNQWPPVSIHIYVEDAHAAWKQAVAAGCKELAPLTDMFWGDRFGKLGDPFGHHWSIAQHIEDVSPEEMDNRAAAAFASMQM